MKNVLLIAVSFLLLSIYSRAQTHTPKRGPQTKGNKSNKEALLIRGPYIQVPTCSTMVLRWRTDRPVAGKVQYGTSPGNLNKAVSDGRPVTEHIVKLSGLQPNTKYYYAIISANKKLQGDKDNAFITLPGAGKEGVYRVGIFGDPGSLTTLQPKVRDQFLKYLGDKDMHAWIALGDIAYNHGWDAEYQAEFFNIYKAKLLKGYSLFTIPGNHDYGDDDAETFYSHDKIDYYKTFSMPVDGESGGVPSRNQAYYSFDIGNIHFLALDSFGEQDSTKLYDTLGTQVQWIKKDLAANKNKGWIVAFWHHPPYSMGSHNSNEQGELIKIRENFLRILE